MTELLKSRTDLTETKTVVTKNLVFAFVIPAPEPESHLLSLPFLFSSPLRGNCFEQARNRSMFIKAYWLVKLQAAIF